MKVSDIQFSQGCCGEHALVAEYIRHDGIGFGLKQFPETGLFSVQVYEADHITIRSSLSDQTESQVNELLGTP